jgi:hypothetical protein
LSAIGKQVRLPFYNLQQLANSHLFKVQAEAADPNHPSIHPSIPGGGPTVQIVQLGTLSTPTTSVRRCISSFCFESK